MPKITVPNNLNLTRHTQQDAIVQMLKVLRKGKEAVYDGGGGYIKVTPCKNKQTCVHCTRPAEFTVSVIEDDKVIGMYSCCEEKLVEAFEEMMAGT